MPYHGKHEAYRAPVMRPPVLEIIECVCYVIVAIVAGGGSGTAKRTQKIVPEQVVLNESEQLMRGQQHVPSSPRTRQMQTQPLHPKP